MIHSQASTAHLRQIDRSASLQQRPNALNVSLLASNTQRCGPVRLQHHRSQQESQPYTHAHEQSLIRHPACMPHPRLIDCSACLAQRSDTLNVPFLTCDIQRCCPTHLQNHRTRPKSQLQGHARSQSLTRHTVHKTHHRLVDCRASNQQRLHAVRVPLLACYTQRGYPASLGPRAAQTSIHKM